MMKTMATAAPVEDPKSALERQAAPVSQLAHVEPGPADPDLGSPWNLSTVIALLLIVTLWARELYTTWGAWGTLSIDVGREIYVPLLLAHGKQLYRDAWFLYGPAAPYFNSYLYRLFGFNLNVLYWAGSLAALGSAILLFLTGMRLSFWLAGGTAAAVLLMGAFQPSLFCFPLPYAFASVYGCLAGCLFLWFAVRASFSKNLYSVFGAGITAAVAMLLKMEFGIACYGVLAILIAGRGLLARSTRTVVRDLAAIAPGISLCAIVTGWMVSIAGVEFITQENIMSWPTAYFMKVFGKMWLERTGFTVSGPAFLAALYRAIPVALVIGGAYSLLQWKRSDARAWLSKILIVLAVALYFIKNNYFLLSAKQSASLFLSTIFFPQDMVLYTIVGTVVVCCYFAWKRSGPRQFGLVLLLTFSVLLAFRILMKMRPTGVAIYYHGPVVLSFLVLLCLLIRGSGRSRRFTQIAEGLLCLACLFPVWMTTRAGEAAGKDFVPLVTERGTVRVPEHLAQSYSAAIGFMKEKASQGESVLSVPEDTGLYFFSGTYCPTRVYSFTPGVLAPGKMVRETIEQIEQKRVKYLLWSNRSFPEYGAPIFGEDFDQYFASYLKSRFAPFGPLQPGVVKGEKDWAAVIWERKEGFAP
jgi:hypothetical protein